ncbi:hypothetical protein [Streptomyces sp. NPDC048057]|uniref:hypothetical protein n=1 Tax=Streptomyces sp. NPDC048057 TaxID=3155628 RepID=UPI0033C71A89
MKTLLHVSRKAAAAAALSAVGALLLPSTTTAQAAAVPSYEITFHINFSQPGDPGGHPEPYGYVRLDFEGGTHHTLWEQSEDNASTRETYGPETYTYTGDLKNIKSISADVDEDDAWPNGDDSIGYGTEPWRGQGDYTFTEDDGSTTVVIERVKPLN